MKNGIAASKGYAIGKVFIQQHEEIVITDEKVTDVAAAKEELNKALEASKVQLEAIKAKTLEEIGGVAGRFEVIVNKPTVIVDYAHTPDGLENVLKAARDITPSDGRLICLFGCGGDRDATKRPKMGAIAEELADVVIVTSDNPRSEEPQQIITDILAGLKSVNEVIVEPDRELAIKEAHKIARENDVVLIAGKGHEDYQILANETIHFDDREKAREIFI